LESVGEGVRSLSARSFKVHHVMHGIGARGERMYLKFKKN
jgi:hypothetical protein